MAKKPYNRAANLGSFLYPAGKKRPSKTALKNAAKMQAPERMTKPVVTKPVAKPVTKPIAKPKKITPPKPEMVTPFSASAKGPLYPG